MPNPENASPSQRSAFAEAAAAAGCDMSGAAFWQALDRLLPDGSLETQETVELGPSALVAGEEPEASVEAAAPPLVGTPESGPVEDAVVKAPPKPARAPRRHPPAKRSEPRQIQPVIQQPAPKPALATEPQPAANKTEDKPASAPQTPLIPGTNLLVEQFLAAATDLGDNAMPQSAVVRKSPETGKSPSPDENSEQDQEGTLSRLFRWGKKK